MPATHLSNATSPSSNLTSPGVLTLKIRGIGNPTSFKNTKSIYRRKNGTPFIATKHEKKEWMQRAARLIESQLYSVLATTGAAITPECWKRFATFWLPLDDAWQFLEIGSVKTILVPAGEEGADVIIERLVPEITPAEAASGYSEAMREVSEESAMIPANKLP